jgi:FKBP-type peptidyl-prolyl cis-trans isomerase
MKTSILALIVACGLSSSLAFAHFDEPKPVAPAATATFTDSDFAKIASMLTGSWKSSAPVTQGDDASKSVQVAIHFAPVTIDGLPNTLYMEAARADKLNTPYREAIVQFYKFKGATHMRTFEFRRIPGFGSAVTGLWAAPDAFPKVHTTDLVGTLDVALTLSGDSATGKAPYPYPTGLNGAVQMTSDIKISKDKLEIADRGFDAAEKQVWGPASGAFTTFTRFSPDVHVSRLANNIIAIDYAGKGTEPFIQANDRVAAHYEGWLASGYKFDSSRDRDQPLNFLQGTLIVGWNEGLLGVGKGAIRRLVIPAAQAYGDRARGMIPANADLFFEIEIMNVEHPQATPKGEGAAAPATEPNAAAKERAVVEEIKRKAAEQANKAAAEKAEIEAKAKALDAEAAAAKKSAQQAPAHK